MRSPPLPIELEAVWDTFSAQWPQRMREKWGPATGKAVLTRLEYVLDALGKHAVCNPALKTKKPRSSHDGDAVAFTTFVSEQMKLKATDGAVYF